MINDVGGNQRLEHDQRVHEPQLLVAKCARQPPDDGETQPFPQPDGSFVARHHEIELHGAEAQLHGDALRVLTHGSGNSAALGRWRHHVAAVADMVAEARLVCLDEIGTEDRAARIAGNEGGARRLYPDPVDLGLRAVGREGVGVARGEGCVQHRPDGGPVGFVELADVEHRGS